MAKKPNSKSRSGATAKPSRSTNASAKPGPSSPSTGDVLLNGLPDPERRHLERCTLDCASFHDAGKSRGNTKKQQEQRQSLTQRAVSILEREHVLVLHNCLSENDIQVLRDTYASLRAAQAGQSAIGEKDPTRRSGTRFYNCLCQLGPACDFYNWKPGTERARTCLNPQAEESVDGGDEGDYTQQNYSYNYNSQQHQHSSTTKPFWKEITDHFHFTHIARVEIVTSHVGCRAQGWHIDGVHGLTVILPLTDVGVRQGPTELDFSVDFVGLWEGDPKVRHGSTDKMRAVLPAGSCLLFNANVSHRGSANIGNRDRPICVLDCSLPATCLAKGGPRDVWSV